MNGDINLHGFKSNDTNIPILICRNDDDVKSAWIYDTSDKNLKKYIDYSTAGENNWGGNGYG